MEEQDDNCAPKYVDETLLQETIDAVKADIQHEEIKEKEQDDVTNDDNDIKDKEESNPVPHQPIIMDRRKTLEYSPSFHPNSKLLGRRQSVDPVRIRSRGKLSNIPDITKKSTDYVPSEVRIPAIDGGSVMKDQKLRPPSRKEMATPILPPSQPRPFVETPNLGRNRALMEAPNLVKLMASHENSHGKRPDSAQSSSTTTTTTSCSLSLSEADSGVSDLSSSSRGNSGIK